MKRQAACPKDVFFCTSGFNEKFHFLQTVFLKSCQMYFWDMYCIFLQYLHLWQEMPQTFPNTNKVTNSEKKYSANEKASNVSFFLPISLNYISNIPKLYFPNMFFFFRNFLRMYFSAAAAGGVGWGAVTRNSRDVADSLTTLGQILAFQTVFLKYVFLKLYFCRHYLKNKYLRNTVLDY